jgi:hypothetical protein
MNTGNDWIYDNPYTTAWRRGKRSGFRYGLIVGFACGLAVALFV